MSGWPGDMTEKQSAALSEFRDRVKDLGIKKEDFDDDYFMSKWLRARNFNLKQSESMLRAHMDWRRNWRVDTIIDDFSVPEVLQKYYTGGFAGVDRQFNPVFWDPFGKIDLKGILQSAKKKDVLRMKIKLLEQLKHDMKHGKYAKMAGKSVHQVIIIFDLESFGLKHLWKPGLDVLLHVLSMFEANYPELLSRTVVVNAPRVFPLAYKLVRPVLSEATANKVEVHTTRYYDAILKYIDEDNIPVHYGGKMKDSRDDGDCKEWIGYGGVVPKEMRVTPAESLTAENLSSAEIPARRALRLVYQVKHANSILSYEFISKDHDIAFGVFRQSDDQSKKIKHMEVVIKSQRVNSHMVPEDGTVELATPGTYVVVFDNKFSWMRSKRISYNITVVEPLQVGEHGEDEMEGDKQAVCNEVIE